MRSLSRRKKGDLGGTRACEERVREYVCVRVCVRIAERRRSQRQTGVAVWLLQRCLTDDDLQPGMGCGVIASLIESGPRERDRKAANE